MTTFEDIVYETGGGIATLRLNRPDRLNAVGVRTHAEIRAALSAADGDDTVRAVVVTGTGRAFCAGTDLSDGFDLPTGGDAASGDGVPPDVGGEVTLRLYEMRKPVIAAVNGVAAGFGATFLLAMDRRIAGAGSRFLFPFVRRGIMPESCSSWFLTRLVGMGPALDWMLTGRAIPAEEALARGLIDEIVEADELLPRARAWAAEIAANCAPASVAVARQLMWRMSAVPDPPHRARSGVTCAAGAACASGLGGRRKVVFRKTPARIYRHGGRCRLHGRLVDGLRRFR